MVRFEKFKNWLVAENKEQILACMKISRFREIREHFMHANISCSTVFESGYSCALGGCSMHKHILTSFQSLTCQMLREKMNNQKKKDPTARGLNTYRCYPALFYTSATNLHIFPWCWAYFSPLWISEHFQCLVQSIYNLAYAQAAAVISCKFTAEERSAWWFKSKEVRRLCKWLVNSDRWMDAAQPMRQ